MVEPCDKYQGLVVGPDGQTVADPYGILPTIADYEEWHEVALSIIERAEAERTAAYELFGALPEEIWQPLDLIRERWAAMGGAMAQLLNPNAVLWGSTIVKMVEIARDAACQLGLIEVFRVEIAGGEPTVNVPKPPPLVPTNGSSSAKGSSSKGGGKGMGLGLVLLLGLAAWGMSRD
jgi:hypothetical protein